MRMELRDLCRKLRLAHVYDYATRPDIPEEEQRAILTCLRHEQEQRELAKANRLVKQAGFHSEKQLQNYVWHNQITFPTYLTKEDLITLEFIDKKENLIFIGTPGTGKTSLATALGLEACKDGKQVRFYRVLDLVDKLLRATRKGTLERTRKSIQNCDLLILDELGYLPLDQEGSELLFHLISDFYERKSLIITTNLEFSAWNKVFQDPRLTSALVDRLIHHAHIFSFSGESYRFTNALSTRKN